MLFGAPKTDSSAPLKVPNQILNLFFSAYTPRIAKVALFQKTPTSCPGLQVPCCRLSQALHSLDAPRGTGFVGFWMSVAKCDAVDSFEGLVANRRTEPLDSHVPCAVVWDGTGVACLNSLLSVHLCNI